jgi:hypothetical protein
MMGMERGAPLPPHEIRISNSAVSKHNCAISPHMLREVCSELPTLFNQRAQGMPGARCARGLVCTL